MSIFDDEHEVLQVGRGGKKVDACECVCGLCSFTLFIFYQLSLSLSVDISRTWWEIFDFQLRGPQFLACCLQIYSLSLNYRLSFPFSLDITLSTHIFTINWNGWISSGVCVRIGFQCISACYIFYECWIGYQMKMGLCVYIFSKCTFYYYSYLCAMSDCFDEWHQFPFGYRPCSTYRAFIATRSDLGDKCLFTTRSLNSRHLV